MKDFLESLIKSIVENPDAVSITEEVDDQERQLLTITVDPEDMGRVIGKSGKVINAVRTIMRVVAIRQGVKVRIDIKDDNPPAASTPSAEPAVKPEAPVEEQTDESDATPSPADLVANPDEDDTK